MQGKSIGVSKRNDGSNSLLTRLVLFSGITLFVTGIMTYSELMYLWRGRTAVAVVERIWEAPRTGRFSFGQTELRVAYSFIDAEQERRRANQAVPAGWTGAVGDQVQVQYRPGKYGASRLAGNVRWLPITLFLASAALTVVLVFMLRLKSNAEEKPFVPPRSRLR